MIYILQSNKIVNLTPEMSYGGGISMQFKKGWFVFDTENADDYFWKNDIYIEIDYDRYNIDEKLMFKNKIKAELVFLRLKIYEMEKNSMSFFFPSKYERLKKDFKQMIATYPQYAI